MVSLGYGLIWLGLCLGLEPALKQDDPDRIFLAHENNQIVRSDADGITLWATKVPPRIDGYDPPNVLWDSERVYMTWGPGVAALDLRNGKLLWQSKGAKGRLFLSGDLLFSIGESSKKAENGEWLIGRSALTGAIIVELKPPRSLFGHILETMGAGEFIVVPVREFPRESGNTLVLYQKDRSHFTVRRQAIAAAKCENDLVLLTTNSMMRLSPKGMILWEAPLMKKWSIVGGGLVDVTGTDIVGFAYAHASDSGVYLLRVDLASGKVLWDTSCERLGVGHTEYNHRATVRLKNNHLHVSSVGSYGIFYEILDLQSGRQLNRAFVRDERYR